MSVEASPFEGLIETPQWFKPIENILYFPSRWFNENVGRPEDQCVYMVASIVALLSCFALKAHPGSATSRKVFSTAMGLSIHYYVFGKSGLASLASNLASYLAIRVAPTQYSHIAVFVIAGLALALSQIHKQIYSFGVNGLDVPMNLMFNYCRLTSLACCVRDGQTVIEARKQKKEPDLKRRELQYAVEEMPSFFDFMAYLYFCGAAISGPFYEFKDFQQMMAREGDFKDVPSTLVPGLKRFAHAWGCVATGAILASQVDEKFMLTPEFLNDFSIPQKLFYQYLVVKLVMQTYLVGWCLMECGPIAAGLSFNGYDKETGEAKHDRVRSCDIWKLETSFRIKDFLANWNISAHMWLKYYIFLRMLPNNKKGKGQAAAALTTFIVSSIWHGFYPGFFSFFLGAGLLDYQAKLAGQALYPFVEKWMPDTLMYFICWLWCYLMCGYFATSFVLLSFENFHQVYASMHYIMHIVLAAFIVISLALMPTKKASRGKAAPDDDKANEKAKAE